MRWTNVVHFSRRELSTMTHALSVAADRFKEDVEAFKETSPGLLFTAKALERLVEQFERQEQETRALLEKFMEHEDSHDLVLARVD